MVRCPKRKLLMDNGRAFRSKKVKDLCNKWAVNRLFRAAYKLRGNGIVEPKHRTVKLISCPKSQSEGGPPRRNGRKQEQQ